MLIVPRTNSESIRVDSLLMGKKLLLVGPGIFSVSIDVLRSKNSFSCSFSWLLD